MERVASHIAGAINMYALYPPNHPRVRDSIARVLRGVRDVVEGERIEALAYLIVGDDLLAGETLIREMSLPVREFVGVLRQHGVESLTIAAGATEEEIDKLVGALAGSGRVESSAHVQLGTVHLVMEDKPKEGEARLLLTDRIQVMREAWARFRVEKRLPVDQLEELVWSLIDSVGATTRAMLPLAQLREHDEYTFVNAINVSLLVIAQARSFGIWGPMLHAFGMAGLLHDIGKLSVPESILNKTGKLEDDEWRMMMRHPSMGAADLVEQGAPPLAVIVAFEHHLRHDGRPNYPLLQARRTPHLASRMTAIADAYDGMCAARPYQSRVDGGAALEILRNRSGSFYDPTLVGNFARIMESAAGD